MMTTFIEVRTLWTFHGDTMVPLPKIEWIFTLWKLLAEVAGIALLLGGALAQAPRYDLLLKGGHVVEIKINPSGAPACCSSPEIIREIVGGVQSVGVPASNIFIYDRYAYEIDVGSYQALVPPGVRVVGIQDAFSGLAGYDMNVYCQANFFGE